MSKSNHTIEPEEIMAYLDGELSIEQASRAADHLEQCEECQKLAADLRQVSQSMMAWEVEAPEMEMRADAAVALAKAPTRPKPARSKPRWRSLLTRRRMAWAGGFVVAVFVIVQLATPNYMMKMPATQRAAQQIAQQPTGSADSNGVRHGLVDGEPIEDQQSKVSAYLTPGQGTVGRLHKRERGLIAGKSTIATPTGPMIIRTAQISLSTKDFEKTRAGVEDVLKRHSGYVGQLNVTAPVGGARTLNATLRVPASQLDATLAEMKSLGKVVGESQGGEEVTQRYVDLEARLANARNSEVRLTQILQRAGKLSDVLAVEEQIEQVRGEIEQMTADKKTLGNQIDFATLTATVAEEFKEQLQVVPESTSTRFRNAAVEGYRTMVDGIVGLLVFLVSVGPSLLLWIALLFFPARWAWRKLRKKMAEANAEPVVE